MRKPGTRTILTALLLGAAFACPSSSALAQSPSASAQAGPRAELDSGTRLTRAGLLQQAIPHLLAAQKSGVAPYATGVNLGICYLGTGNYDQAIATLQALRRAGHDTPVVNNLLAQSYLGANQSGQAFAAFSRAAVADPKNEKLYAFMADACTDHRDYVLGLRIVDLGLQQLPVSARLHYERALFLSQLGRFEDAKPDFDAAARLGSGTYISVLAQVQKNLYEDNLSAATSLLRAALRAGHRDYQTLSLLGSVLLFEGASPGTSDFAQAQAALEESARLRPDYSATQIALGKLYLRERRYSDAAAHLETGRRLEPENPSIYASLANAYRRLGDNEKAREMSTRMGQLLARGKAAPAPAHP